MKKLLKTVLALTLCFSLIGAAATPAYAAFEPGTSVQSEVGSLKKGLLDFADRLINSLVGYIASCIHDPKEWVSKASFDAAAEQGTGEFSDSPAEGAYWSMGYSSASLLTGNELDGKHYVGGSLSLSGKTATALHDDLKVRAVAMSDNSGRGTVVFAVVDSYGLTNGEIEKIRSAVYELCPDSDIVSVNVAVLHQHSAVDTFGMNADITKALINPWRAEKVSGINASYQKNMISKTARCVKEAVDSMQKGTLYYGTADFSEFVTDKRDPQVLNTEFDRFRFVADSGRELWLTTSNIHCVGNGAGGTELTGDYPYYMEQIINERYGADFMMILGAEQGTTQDKSMLSLPEDATVSQKLGAYASLLAERFASIDNETQVEPLLNIAHKRVFYKIENNILVFAGKMGLLTNTVVKTGDGYEVATEIGYMEIGEELAVLLVPGEIAAEIVYGGCFDSDRSWTGEDWPYAPLDEAADGRSVIVFGMTNDQIGYIIPDNDYMSILESSGKSLELVSTGSSTASAMTQDFASFIASLQ